MNQNNNNNYINASTVNNSNYNTIQDTLVPLAMKNPDIPKSFDNRYTFGISKSSKSREFYKKSNNSITPSATQDSMNEENKSIE